VKSDLETTFDIRPRNDVLKNMIFHTPKVKPFECLLDCLFSRVRDWGEAGAFSLYLMLVDGGPLSNLTSGLRIAKHFLSFGSLDICQ
jgi:hypothetical protein